MLLPAYIDRILQCIGRKLGRFRLLANSKQAKFSEFMMHFRMQSSKTSSLYYTVALPYDYGQCGGVRIPRGAKIHGRCEIIQLGI